jgi:hypothetical protein
MKCENCELWIKRQLPKTAKKYYPAGRCLHRIFNDVRQTMLTAPETNCRIGVPKP